MCATSSRAVARYKVGLLGTSQLDKPGKNSIAQTHLDSGPQPLRPRAAGGGGGRRDERSEALQQIFCVPAQDDVSVGRSEVENRLERAQSRAPRRL